jgi:hypothetical protein
MTRVFTAAHAAGIGNDINPMRVRLDAKAARANNPLKQANEPPKATPAAPEEKPRVRVKAVSRPVEAPKPSTQARMSGKDFSAWQKQNPNAKIKGGLAHEENQTQKIIRAHKNGTLAIQNEDGAPTNQIGSGNIAGFSPILGPILRRRKKRHDDERRAK